MSEVKNIFENHNIHETISNVKVITRDIQADGSLEEQDELRRIRKIWTRFEQVVNNIDPDFIDFSILDAVNAKLTDDGVLGALNQFHQNQDGSSLEGVATTILAAVSDIPEFRAAMSSKIKIPATDHIEEEIRDSRKQVESISSDLEASLKNLSALKLEIDNKIQEAESSLSSLSDQIASSRKSLEDMTGSWQAQFAEAQNTRALEFTNLIQETKSQALNMMEEEQRSLAMSAQREYESYTSEFNELKSDVVGWHQEILDIYQLVAADSVGAGYLKNADDEQKAANFWRWMTVGFILAAVIWLIFVAGSGLQFMLSMFGNSDTGSDNLTTDDTKLLSRSFFTSTAVVGSLLFGAAFSASQSAKHRNFEQRARRFGLEMKALNPFLSGLKDEEKLEIKKELSKEIFGKYDIVYQKGEKVSDHTNFKYLIDALERILKESKI